MCRMAFPCFVETALCYWDSGLLFFKIKQTFAKLFQKLLLHTSKTILEFAKRIVFQRADNFYSAHICMLFFLSWNPVRRMISFSHLTLPQRCMQSRKPCITITGMENRSTPIGTFPYQVCPPTALSACKTHTHTHRTLLDPKQTFATLQWPHWAQNALQTQWQPEKQTLGPVQV